MRSLLAALLFWSACTQPVDIQPPADAAAPVADAGTGAPDLALPRTELWNSDVTIVYPLPAPAQLSLMMGATTYGDYGRFVPYSAFMQLPGPLDPRQLSSTRALDNASWSALRLVAARLDPCFGSRGEVPDAQCHNQVRLVFQGIHPVGSQTAADDGAIHALYELPRSELLALTRELILLTERQGSYVPGRLGVHPILERQGVGGAFAQGLTPLLRRYLGETRLVRMTFFLRLDTLQPAWDFGGFDHSGATFTPLAIPTAAPGRQSLGAGFPAAGDLAGVTPTPTSSPDNLFVLINGAMARSVTAATRQAAYAAALRIQHPLRHTPDTIDCLSCHVALAAQSFGEAAFGLSSQGHPDRYTSTRDLSYSAPTEPSLENLHAASYNGAELGINQRTANETAAIAIRLTELLRQ